MASLDDLAERVDRLVLRYEEQLRVNQLLESQLQQLRGERDNLRSRLNAARARIDTLIERLPPEPAPGPSTPPATHQADHGLGDSWPPHGP